MENCGRQAEYYSVSWAIHCRILLVGTVNAVEPH